MQKQLVPLAAVILSVACPASPPRPQSVSTKAVWAGGSDGGAWIACTPSFKEPHLGYDCIVYHDSGAVWAQGSFIVAERHNGKHEYPSGGFLPPDIGRYEWFDGRQIAVNANRSLVPFGLVDYPSGNGHGKRVRYQFEGDVEQAY